MIQKWSDTRRRIMVMTTLAHTRTDLSPEKRKWHTTSADDVLQALEAHESTAFLLPLLQND
jgi:hypothetical protein